MRTSNDDARDAGQKFPPLGYYFLLAGAVAIVMLVGRLSSVSTAVYVLSALLIGQGIARVALPEGLVPRIRGRAFDAGLHVALAAILILFAHWGDAPMIR